MKKLIISILFFVVWFTVGLILSTLKVSNPFSVIGGFVAAWAFIVIMSPQNTKQTR